MSSITPGFDQTRSEPYDWTSPAGLSNIKSLVQPYLSFQPHDFQAYDSGCILNGRDVFCISATGDGKSALIYIPALVRKDTITVVVEPTNALENNMASNLKNKGLTAIVINAEEIKEAKTKSRNLWKEAKDGQYQVIALSPEMLKSREYSELNNDTCFRQRWRVLVVDEAHLVDHWGTDFRKAYADIWSLRSRGPEHLTFVAMSATVEKGAQMKRILQRLGYREDAFHLDKRDCQRHNVDLIFRTVQFTCTGFEFHDLDWLVPHNLASASDVPKRVLYSDTIEIGHRIAVYLRGLLPSHLQKSANNLIRHMHSMNCVECKKEGLAALTATDSERTTAIFVATAVWEVGLDVPDISCVIMFPAPASASSIIQRAGRPARSRGMRGEAIVYVKKTEIDASLEYAQRDPVDSRLLDPKNLSVSPSEPTGSQTDSSAERRSASEVNGGVAGGKHQLGDVSETAQETVVSTAQETQGNIRVESENIEMGVEMESEIPDAPEAANNVPMPETRVISSAVQTSNSAGLDSGTGGESSTRPMEATKQKAVRGKGKAKGLGASRKVGNKKAVDLPHPEQGKRPCVARHLIIAAHARGLCISRQINIIYDNPGADRDCGRCSSCLPRPLPTPRPMPSAISTSPESTAPPSDNAADTATLPSYMKLTRAEVEELSQELNHVSRRIWRKIIHGPESLLIGPSSFLRPDIVKYLTTDFHLLSSVQDLEHRIRHHWRYWDRASSELWSELAVLIERFHEKAEARHQRALENQREARGKRGAEVLHDDIIAKGLGHIKRVRLVIPGTTSALDSGPRAVENDATSFSISADTAPFVGSPPVSSPPCSVNARTSTPDPMPARLAPPVLSPSNRATGSSSARPHIDLVLGQSIPPARFYGTSPKTRKRAASPEYLEPEQPPAKVRQTSRGRKAAGAMSQSDSTEGETPRKENTTEMAGPCRRSKRAVRPRFG